MRLPPHTTPFLLSFVAGLFVAFWMAALLAYLQLDLQLTPDLPHWLLSVGAGIASGLVFFLVSRVSASDEPPLFHQDSEQRAVWWGRILGVLALLLWWTFSF